MTRYGRQIQVIGADGQARLARAQVLIVGAGGLAAPLLPLLVGAGVGRITLVDPDVVEVTNLHRQTLFRHADLGRPKAQTAVAALAGLNTDCRITAVTARLDPSNVEKLSDGCDLILDCADSFAASYTLSDQAFTAGVPLISASVLGRGGYVGGFCGGAPSLRAVFPDLPARAGSCASDGVLGTAVAVVASLQADMALALLAGLDRHVLGRIVSFDGDRHQYGGFDFATAPEPAFQVPFIAASDLRPDDLLIDLRAPEEGPPVRPDMLRRTVADIGPDLPLPAGRTVLCCKSGLRAWTAAARLAGARDSLALLATG